MQHQSLFDLYLSHLDGLKTFSNALVTKWTGTKEIQNHSSVLHSFVPSSGFVLS